MRGTARGGAAAGVLADHLAGLGADPFSAGAAPVLLVDDRGEEIEAVLADLGRAAERWRRRVIGSAPATAWPPEGPAAGACIRLPKGRQATDMTLHAALSRLAEGAPVWLYGGNDEGIRSADVQLAPLCTEVRTVEARRHCRVWRAQRSEAPARGGLDDWAEEVELALPGGPTRAVSFPGLFAHGRLDPATRLLVETLDSLPPKLRVLDFGCGAGALLLAVRQLAPRAALHGLDADALALEAARRNLPGATLHASDGLQGLPTGARFDLVLSNPPLHEGVASDTRVLEQLAAGIAPHLARQGELRLVAQRTVPLGRLLAPDFPDVAILRETRSFKVWRASSPKSPKGGRSSSRGGPSPLRGGPSPPRQWTGTKRSAARVRRRSMSSRRETERGTVAWSSLRTCSVPRSSPTCRAV